ncbi:hypothetical protein V5P93_006424 [Actinokineospora auranticolor]|uniref:Uncharacterized protein n=1 Tax=Actinokineospora auranticolor TaxID=155976 RepID=A0A2S6GFR4_9PSEU|nr:hypothetical protein [Actinokineospora auranticolor]PPK64011.1 hypothetical protein CLV40_1222 [Actinokineospora auranticolor]
MNLLDHITAAAALTARTGHDPAALAADAALRFEWYRAAAPDDEPAFLALILRDPEPAVATAAAAARIDDRAAYARGFAEWAARVRPAVEHVEPLRARLSEWCLVHDALAGRDVPIGAVLAASDWAQRRLAAQVDGELLALLAVHGRTRRVRALTRVPRPVRRRVD